MIGHDALVLDTNCLIYHLDDPDGRRGAWLAERIFRPAVAGRLRLTISALTLAELLVRPYADGRSDRAQALRRALETLPGLTVTPVTADIAAAAARVRAAARLRLPDAIIVATAGSVGAAVLTNDQALQRDEVPVEIVLLDEAMATS